jgi:hypothetical protein
LQPVLHITSAWDTTADLVIQELSELGVESIRWNTETFPLASALLVEVADDRTCAVAQTDSGRTVELSTVRSVLYRRPEPPDYGGLSDVSERSKSFGSQESTAALGALRH